MYINWVLVEYKEPQRVIECVGLKCCDAPPSGYTVRPVSQSSDGLGLCQETIKKWKKSKAHYDAKAGDINRQW